MSVFSYTHKSPVEATCGVCGRTGEDISGALNVCRECEQAARSAGLGRIKIGNMHLLS